MGAGLASAILCLSLRGCNLRPGDSLFVSGEPDWAGPPSPAREIRHDKDHEDSTGCVCGATRRGHRGTGRLSIPPWQHRGDQDFSRNRTVQNPGHRNWVAECRRTGTHHPPVPPRKSIEYLRTNPGHLLRAEGLPVRTPIPGAPPGEFSVHVDLTITGGSGKYEGAYGTMEFDGLGHTTAVPPTTELIYKGTVCGPNIKADEN